MAFCAAAVCVNFLGLAVAIIVGAESVSHDPDSPVTFALHLTDRHGLKASLPAGADRSHAFPSIE
jgi:hypothetical protein